ncbi:hypothetical protein TNCV_286721 [Trichonephila clavipes]|nr:hypothetical protein TNCV_286721 [Trichonephila clavipes]
MEGDRRPVDVVWEFILLNLWTELQVFYRGYATTEHYSPPAADVQQLLESEDIAQMDGPAFFSDLNSIERVWNALEGLLVNDYILQGTPNNGNRC